MLQHLQAFAPRLGIATTQSLLKRYLLSEGTLLELGCGRFSSALQVVGDFDYIGVDGFLPYLSQLQQSQGKMLIEAGRTFQIHHESLMDIDFHPKSVTQIVMIDVLEHLTREDGEALLEKCSLWATHSIIVKTTNGFFSQDAFDGNPFQEHLSGWGPEDLIEHGFQVQGLSGLKCLRRSVSHDTWINDLSASMKYRPRKVWLGIAGLSQWYVNKHYDSAFELFGVKLIS